MNEQRYGQDKTIHRADIIIFVVILVMIFGFVWWLSKFSRPKNYLTISQQCHEVGGTLVYGRIEPPVICVKQLLIKE